MIGTGLGPIAAIRVMINPRHHILMIRPKKEPWACLGGLRPPPASSFKPSETGHVSPAPRFGALGDKGSPDGGIAKP